MSLIERAYETSSPKRSEELYARSEPLSPTRSIRSSTTGRRRCCSGGRRTGDDSNVDSSGRTTPGVYCESSTPLRPRKSRIDERRLRKRPSSIFSDARSTGPGLSNRQASSVPASGPARRDSSHEGPQSWKVNTLGGLSPSARTAPENQQWS